MEQNELIKENEKLKKENEKLKKEIKTIKEELKSINEGFEKNIYDLEAMLERYQTSGISSNKEIRVKMCQTKDKEEYLSISEITPEKLTELNMINTALNQYAMWKMVENVHKHKKEEEVLEIFNDFLLFHSEPTVYGIETEGEFIELGRFNSFSIEDVEYEGKGELSWNGQKVTGVIIYPHELCDSIERFELVEKNIEPTLSELDFDDDSLPF